MSGFLCGRSRFTESANGRGLAELMRMSLRFRNKAAKLFVFIVLLSAVACSELPELAKLIDNPSNDFTPPAYVMSEIESTLTEHVMVKTNVSRMESRLFPSDRPQQPHNFRSSSDLLLLYSIRRT